MAIHFGTDGWRGVISDTFTFDNLRLVTQAVADAVASEEWLNGSMPSTSAPDPRTMVVGFDTRFLSDRYAVEASRVLAANGYRVHLTTADVPTPTLSHAVLQRGAIAGLMITASHNAPRYNGLKLKAAYAGSATPEQCRRVEVYITDNESRARGPNLMDYDRARREGLIERFDPSPEYETHLRSLIDFEVIGRRPPRVIVDSMHGSGRGLIAKMLEGTGCDVVEIRGEMNPGFGGVHPEPILRYLGELSGALAAGRGELGLATDGDGDRIGAMDGRGRFVDPHRILGLALQYLVEHRGWHGKVIKTVSTTQMLNRLAAGYGLEVVETPVGFNHIAEHMLRGEALLGGEESGGMSFHGHIPEGDGILMGLLLVEMVAATGAPLEAMVDDLLVRAGPAYYERVDLRLSAPVSKARMVDRLLQEAPATIGGVRVKQVNPLDGVKFLLEDESWLLIRPSGTEPVLRVYAEARDRGMVQALVAHGRTVAEGKPG